ncbi:hypothetical protein TNCV_717631 [Trichonephila clavipes]|nr:hypothetical protein TNCV_717631 [Trichonephila clavipes]
MSVGINFLQGQLNPSPASTSVDSLKTRGRTDSFLIDAEIVFISCHGLSMAIQQNNEKCKKVSVTENFKRGEFRNTALLVKFGTSRKSPVISAAFEFRILVFGSLIAEPAED